MKRALKSCGLALLLALGVNLPATAFASQATVPIAAADVSDAVAPWVQQERWIPVYVDGQLAGWIVITVWVWVDSENPIDP